MGGFLAPPTTHTSPIESSGKDASNTGSMARAIRGVKSLARIGGASVAEELKKEEKKAKKSKSSRKEVRNAPKSSSSSFEVGAASPLKPLKGKENRVEKKKSILGLGLGLPVSLRMKGSSTTPSEIPPSIFASTVQDENAARRSSDVRRTERLSVESAYLLQPRAHQQPSRTPSISSNSSYSSAIPQDQRASMSSGGSSVRPMSGSSSARSSLTPAPTSAFGPRRASNASSSGGAGYSYYDGISKRHSADSDAPAAIKRDSLDVKQTGADVERRSSGSSIRWDEARLQSVKRRVLEGRRTSAQDSQSASDAVDAGKETTEAKRHSKEGRRRGGIMDVFPGITSEVEPDASAASGSEDSHGYPMLMLESATSDGHGKFHLVLPTFV